MELSDRQLRILNRVLKSDAGVTVKELASQEDVSAQTVYNDLKLLENIRLSVKRGLIDIQSCSDKKTAANQKINDNRELRENACFFVIDKVMGGKPKGVCFIDGGSTGYLFFECLRSRAIHDLTILTNNPLILGKISEDHEFFFNNSVYSIGGKLDPVRLSLYSINRKNGLFPGDDDGHAMDYFILGFRAISPDGSVYISNEEEVAQKKDFISKSKNLVLIATPEKFSASGLFRVSSLKEEIEKNNKKVHVVFSVNEGSNFNESGNFKELEKAIGKSSMKFLK